MHLYFPISFVTDWLCVGGSGCVEGDRCVLLIENLVWYCMQVKHIIEGGRKRKERVSVAWKFHRIWHFWCMLYALWYSFPIIVRVFWRKRTVFDISVYFGCFDLSIKWKSWGRRRSKGNCSVIGGDCLVIWKKTRMSLWRISKLYQGEIRRYRLPLINLFLIQTSLDQFLRPLRYCHRNLPFHNHHINNSTKRNIFDWMVISFDPLIYNLLSFKY